MQSLTEVNLKLQERNMTTAFGCDTIQFKQKSILVCFTHCYKKEKNTREEEKMKEMTSKSLLIESLNISDFSIFAERDCLNMQQKETQDTVQNATLLNRRWYLNGILNLIYSENYYYSPSTAEN